MRGSREPRLSEVTNRGLPGEQTGLQVNQKSRVLRTSRFKTHQEMATGLDDQ